MILCSGAQRNVESGMRTAFLPLAFAALATAVLFAVQALEWLLSRSTQCPDRKKSVAKGERP